MILLMPVQEDGWPRTYLDLVLAPPYSGSHRQVTRVLLVLGLLSLAVGLGFLSAGAWPVLGFFGLDVALLYLAFRHYAQRSLRRERIILNEHELRVEYATADGAVSEVTLDPWKVRLRSGVRWMTVTQDGRQWPLGRFLSEGELDKARRHILDALRRQRRPHEGRAQ